ncbi:MAG: thymidine phosphorylase [Pseudomonadota bacterium]
MDARAILSALRRGETLDAEAARWFATAIAAGNVSDAQTGAFAMGICRAPLSRAARVALTEAMRDSGDVLAWDLPGPVVDKHSTGGVGDCVSLTLAPALAACGVYVPMISGRGLGHTGGTLDKLEAIPGYRTDVSEAEFRTVVRDTGAAIVSASAALAPADKRLYATRDVTGTVESIDLITASILSKKLAAGLDALVLDVKCGSGAFMKTRAEAQALARALVETANGAGCRTSAWITAMDQPLVTAAGNALEVAEVMETLTVTYVTSPLWEITVALGAEALALAGIDDGRAKIDAALRSGAAAERFGAMVAALGGPADFLDRWRDRLPGAPFTRAVAPSQPGFIDRIDTEALGLAVVHLGGGRLKETDRVNPAVGLSRIAGLGEEVGPERPLALIHAASEAEADAAEARIRAAFTLGAEAADPPELLLEHIGPGAADPVPAHAKQGPP